MPQWPCTPATCPCTLPQPPSTSHSHPKLALPCLAVPVRARQMPFLTKAPAYSRQCLCTCSSNNSSVCLVSSSSSKSSICLVSSSSSSSIGTSSNRRQECKTAWGRLLQPHSPCCMLDWCCRRCNSSHKRQHKLAGSNSRTDTFWTIEYTVKLWQSPKGCSKCLP